MPETMRAMRVEAPRGGLVESVVPVPEPGPGEVLIRVEACGVCRTDLHIVDADIEPPTLPVIPGHEIVGRVAACGAGVRDPAPGSRVGVPWLGGTCGSCAYCRDQRENLCDRARFTGFDRDGGYAEYCVADARFCFSLSDSLDPVAVAPLLCAGLIGYRALRFAGSARRLGVMGFGAAAHILAQVVAAQGRELYAFTRPGDAAAQAFARDLGAVWAGGSDETPSRELDAIIIFAPVGALVPRALECLCKGGRVVCGGIHMSDIPAFPYAALWGEREIVSVANLTRADAREFLELAAQTRIVTQVRRYPLARANEALDDLRAGRIEGAAVIESARP